MATFDFSNATVLSYNQTSNFLGDGVARLSSTRDISIDVFSRNIRVNGDRPGTGISENWETFSNELLACDNFAENIVLNGYNLGKGVIRSAAITEENPVRVGYHKIDISIPSKTFSEGESENPDTSLLSGGYYTNFHANLGTNRHMLKTLEEDFSVTVDEENEIEQTHSLTIQFFGEIAGNVGDTNKAIGKARDLAAELFDAADTPQLGFLNGEDGTSASFHKHKSKKHYFTENYDLLSKVCQFSKIYRSDQNEDDYSLKVRTTINLQADGVVTVTERGEIKAEDFEKAQAAVDTEIAAASGASGRCNVSFEAYKSQFLGTEYGGTNTLSTTPNPLFHAQPISIGKEFNRKAKRSAYTIVFSNYIHLETNYLHEFTLNYSQDDKAKAAVTESGTVRPYKPIGVGTSYGSTRTGYLKDLLAAAATFQRAKDFYADQTLNGAETNLKEVRTDLQYAQGSLDLSYSKEYSDDIALRYRDVGSGEGPGSPGSLFKSMNVAVSDELPIFMRGSYVIPNKKDGFSLVHEPAVRADGGAGGAQTNMGTRTINIEAILTRPTTNVFTTIPSVTAELDVCKKIAAQRMYDVTSDFTLDPTKTSIYAESCSFAFDDKRALSLNLVCKYTTARDSVDVAPMGILTKTT
jgi:hypothetical protein